MLLALGIIMVLGTALALLFSAANVFFRDFCNVVSILTNFVRFGVPMIYPYSLVEQRFGRFAEYYLCNPIAEAVLLIQRGFWVGTTDRPGADRTSSNLPADLFGCGVPACSGVCRGGPRRRAAGLHPAREQDPGAPVMAPSSSASIVVDDVDKEFTLRYHRTLKQMTVALAKRPATSATPSWPSTTSPSRSSRASRSA